MAPRYLRYADAAREALHHDTGLVLARPSTAAASARDQFDPPHVRDVATTSVRLAFKLTLKPNVKIIAHGSALRHNPDITDMWEGSPAYVVTTKGDIVMDDLTEAIRPWQSTDYH